MAEILWHRRETRRPTENTHFCLNGGKAPAYSPTTISIRFAFPFAEKRGLSPFSPAREIADVLAWADANGAMLAAKFEELQR